MDRFKPQFINTCFRHWFNNLMKIDSLDSNWLRLLTVTNANLAIGTEVFKQIVKAHCDSTRKYHNLNHVQHLLALIEEAKTIADNLTVVQFAAWFHDYIYDPQANDNEFKSAEYAEKILNTLGVASDLIQSVKQIILSTQKHVPLINTVDNLIFLDVDLAILGTSPNKYQEYARAIRQEYSWLSDRQYQQGRKQVLTNFLTRKRIYYTDYFYQKFELKARFNIVSEIRLYA